MAETKKRIIQYNEELTPALDDYLIMDSPTAGTRKILASNIGGGGIDYSTSEQDTGVKWIDGKPIYQKTYTNIITSISLTSLNIDMIVGYHGMWKSVYGPQRNLDFYGSSTEYSRMTFDSSYSSMQLNVTGWSISSGFITIFYTKTTDTV